MNKYILLNLLAIFGSVSAQTIPSENEKIIELENPNNTYRISVKTYSDGTLSRSGNTVTVSLLHGQNSYTVRSILVGNSVLVDKGIETIELDNSNEDAEYLITSSIVGSNFDAVTGLIVYASRYTWNIVEIPSNKFEINKKSEASKNYITFNDNEYLFERGVFIKQEQ